jgi:hypothetical protein
MDAYEMGGYQVSEYEMDEYERPIPEDPDVIDRDPYIIPDPAEEEGPDDRPRPDEEEEPQRFPGEEPPGSMLVGSESRATR